MAVAPGTGFQPFGAFDPPEQADSRTSDARNKAVETLTIREF
jgi:hypothetical protein